MFWRWCCGDRGNASSLRRATPCEGPALSLYTSRFWITLLTHQHRKAHMVALLKCLLSLADCHLGLHLREVHIPAPASEGLLTKQESESAPVVEGFHCASEVLRAGCHHSR